MKITKKLLLCLVFIISVHCGSENEEDLQPRDEENRCEDNTATLSGAVSTIINNSCAVSGCHVAGTGRVDFSVKENIIQNATQIRSFTQSGFMPPADASSISNQQKDDIFCWVESGAQDN